MAEMVWYFRREKYVPNGGPAGGDGGHGGNVVFEVDESIRTLMDFRYKRHFKAPRGEHGMSKGMHGKNAEDLIIKVPPGTVVINEETEAVIADLVEHGKELSLQKQDAVDVEIQGLQHLQIQRQNFLKKVSQGKN